MNVKSEEMVVIDKVAIETCGFIGLTIGLNSMATTGTLITTIGLVE